MNDEPMGISRQYQRASWRFCPTWGWRHRRNACGTNRWRNNDFHYPAPIHSCFAFGLRQRPLTKANDRLHGPERQPVPDDYRAHGWRLVIDRLRGRWRVWRNAFGTHRWHKQNVYCLRKFQPRHALCLSQWLGTTANHRLHSCRGQPVSANISTIGRRLPADRLLPTMR